jgi:acetylornithine deacetylase/succinyl-diaminopimelate desuccinylase-like protein
MTIEELHKEIDKNWSKHLSETRRILRIPSVSATGEGIRETADALDEMLSGLGAKTKQYKASRNSHPLVYGHLDVGAKKSLAVYGMYDVQPPGNLDEWDSPPFGAAIVKKEPYGEILVNRGAYNSKASLIGTVLAAKTMVDKDQVPVNLHFFLEGEEESGGLSLPTFIRKNKARLSDIDAGVWFDYSEDSRGNVDIALGSKGCVTFDLIAEGNENRGPMKGQVHSSVAVVVESPVLRLIKAISTFVDEDQNPTIKGMWDDVRPPSKQDLELIKKLTKRFDRKAYLDEIGVKKAKMDGSDEELLKKYLFEPSVNVAGLIAGYTGEGYSTILPGRALAKVDIRTVPDMTNEKTRRIVREHLDRNGFSDVRMTRYEDYPWSKIPLEEDITQASIAAMKHHGKDPRIWPLMAGSAPMYVFDKILGIPHCGTGLGFGGGAHAPNEFAVVKGMKDFEKSAITVFWKYMDIAAHKKKTKATEST